MVEPRFLLGVQIKQAYSLIYIHETKHVRKLLKKFNQDDVKEMCTSMHLTTFLGLEKETNPLDNTFIQIDYIILTLPYYVYLCAHL